MAAPTAAISSASASGRLPCSQRKLISVLLVFCAMKTMSTTAPDAVAQMASEAAPVRVWGSRAGRATVGAGWLGSAGRSWGSGGSSAGGRAAITVLLGGAGSALPAPRSAPCGAGRPSRRRRERLRSLERRDDRTGKRPRLRRGRGAAEAKRSYGIRTRRQVTCPRSALLHYSDDPENRRRNG